MSGNPVKERCIHIETRATGLTARRSLWRKRAVAGFLLSLLLAAAAVWTYRGWTATRQVDALHARCVTAMMAQTCDVTRREGSAAAPSQAELTATADSALFVAGFGRVDPALVARWRRMDVDMCAEVRQSCQTAPGAAVCRLGQVLYPAR